MLISDLTIEEKNKSSDSELKIGFSFDLEEHLDEIKAEYIKLALKESGGNITKASKLLKYKNYQTLKNNMKTLGIK